MNRRNFIKTTGISAILLSCGSLLPLSYSQNYPKILNKWKPVLNHSSEEVPPLHPSKHLDVALLMEKYEYRFKDNRDILMSLIPHIRRTEGKFNISVKNLTDKIIKIENEKCIVIYDMLIKCSSYFDIPDGYYNVAIPVSYKVCENTFFDIICINGYRSHKFLILDKAAEKIDHKYV